MRITDVTDSSINIATTFAYMKLIIDWGQLTDYDIYGYHRILRKEGDADFDDGVPDDSDFNNTSKSIWVSRTILQSNPEQWWAGIGISSDFDIRPGIKYRVWYRFKYKLIGSGELSGEGTEVGGQVSTTMDYHSATFTTKKIPTIGSASYTLGGDLVINIDNLTLPDINLRPNTPDGGWILSGEDQPYKLIIKGCRVGEGPTFTISDDGLFTKSSSRTITITPHNAGRLYYSMTRDVDNSGAETPSSIPNSIYIHLVAKRLQEDGSFDYVSDGDRDSSYKTISMTLSGGKVPQIST